MTRVLSVIQIDPDLNRFGVFMLFAWLAVGLALFAIYPPRRAALMTALGGLLLLPIRGVHVEGIPAYGKLEAIGLAVLLGTLVFDSEALLAFRPHWIDLPMLVFCVCPFASSLSNDLGVYDGLSAVTVRVALRWGLPYLIGRVYIRDWLAARELAVAIFVAAVLYVPLCLFENRMSPLLHYKLYGVPAGGLDVYEGFGILGWRPTVFMQTALQLTLFMGTACMIGIWLWSTRALRWVKGVPMLWLVPPLIVTTILTKSVGANVLWIAGTAALLAARRWGTRVPVAALLAFAPVYVVLRGSGLWDAQGLLGLVQSATSEQRTESFKTRIDNENLLAVKAAQRPALGWGRWGRSRVVNDEGKDVSMTDGLWIIVLGESGWVGLSSIMAAMLLPGAIMLRRVRARVWQDARASGLLVLVMLLGVYMIDNLFNAMLNPVWVIAAGGLGAAVAARRGTAHAARPHAEDVLRVKTAA